MTAVQTGIHISEALAMSVHAAANGPDLLPAFVAEEHGYMQEGLATFDEKVWEAARQYGDELAANRMQAGICIAHRILREANDDEPLPQDIDREIGLSARAGDIMVRTLFDIPRYEQKRGLVGRVYAGNPGVPLLLDTLLTKLPSQSGAATILTLYGRLADPTYVPAIHLHVDGGPSQTVARRPARHGFYGGQSRHR